ncbi:MAG: MATE family efflux transporter [Roseburia sp.]|nr:MATE family efflux transporter [Roseburia sp.]
MKQNLLEKMRKGERLAFGQQLLLIFQLSVPAIMAQISSIVMQYIDASMVGQLGADDSASIGLVSSSTWMMGGLCSAASIGFTVQIAQRIGAGEEKKARNIVRQGLLAVLLFSGLLFSVGAGISGFLPVWLGGGEEICKNASRYFLVYAISLPAIQMNNAAGGMLQCSGNMRLPSILHILMCVLDVLFNSVLIFPARNITLLGHQFYCPGAGLGVMGAALGTALAEVVVACLMLYFLLEKSPMLHLRKGEKTRFAREDLARAVKIAVPVGFEQVVMCGAQIMSTKIVAPLGTVAIAANSFSVTAESLCYMPGYGIGTAATTLIGQSIGAGRKDMTRRLGWLTTCLGMAVMAGSGVLLYIFAPFMIGILSPDEAIRELGTKVLRIEAFAEPMYAASIVASGVFRGAGDTLVPSCMNFFSMWAVRIPLAAFLAPRFGLEGVWIAMCIELCVRGILFLLRLAGKRWDQRTERKGKGA